MPPINSAANKDFGKNVKVPHELHRAIKMYAARSEKPIFRVVEEMWRCYKKCGYRPEPVTAVLSQSNISDMDKDPLLVVVRELLGREKTGSLTFRDECALQYLRLLLRANDTARTDTASKSQS